MNEFYIIKRNLTSFHKRTISIELEHLPEHLIVLEHLPEPLIGEFFDARTLA